MMNMKINRLRNFCLGGLTGSALLSSAWAANLEYVDVKGNKGIIAISKDNAIADWEFYAHENFVSVTIPEGIKTIGWHAFDECINLKEIKIPYTVKTLGDFAFWGCTSLKSVYAPRNLMDELRRQLWWLPEAEEESPAVPENLSLTANLQEKTPVMVSEEVLTTTNVEPQVLPKPATPEEVYTGTKIKFVYTNGDYSFFILKQEGSVSAKDVLLANDYYKPMPGIFFPYASPPNDLKDKIAEVFIPNSVKIIEAEAFKNNIELNKIIIPNSVTKIGSNAFDGCTKLTEIIIPHSVEEIGSNAFDGCTALKNIYASDSIIGKISVDDKALPEGVTLSIIRE